MIDEHKIFRVLMWGVNWLLLLVLNGVSCRPVDRLEDEWFHQNYHKIEEALGVEFATPYVTAGERRTEVLAIQSIQKSSPLYQAGARAGDIIRTNENGIDVVVHKWLFDRQEQRVRMILRSGGDGPPLDERTSRIIEFTVPRITKEAG